MKIFFRKVLTATLLALLALTACGKKGPLKYPKDYKRPKFDKVVDEE